MDWASNSRPPTPSPPGDLVTKASSALARHSRNWLSVSTTSARRDSSAGTSLEASNTTATRGS